MQALMCWVAASLAVVSLSCTPVIGQLHRDSLERVNSIKNILDFVNFFGIELPPTEEADTDSRIATGFGSTALEEGTVELAEMANCEPELQTVELDLPVEANILFYPTCVRVEQCLSHLLTCRPTVTETIRLKLLKAAMEPSRSSSNSSNSKSVTPQSNNNSSSSYVEVETIKHVKCECGCIVEEQDCNSTIHTYSKGECACICKNNDEKAACEQQNDIKYWDNDSCTCCCRRPVECSTGETFSQISCKCEQEEAGDGLHQLRVDVM